MRALSLLIGLLLPALWPAVALAVEARPGDLLFVSAGQTGLSAAIDDATAREGGTRFDHVALVADGPGELQVLHADEKGSRQQTLAEFRQDARDKQRQIVVYRLRAAPPQVLADAIATARTMLGKPYNTAYVLNEDSYYCSDFIERAFRTHHVFALQPMNFRNPQTGKISQHWVDLYAGMGMAVPQDLPGTNPNDMAATPALQRVGLL
ncbi:YiiX/YebB-like N1pC/P60 family cysteine hydrolase [Stenotrophomonas sp. B1-1]|uniref:YiiX/YebB-like N1pC/P60 family cysteine hydrolase n=1 Tax=Stenotrophomonas sp. B1-1 TaxID=2710648 RepID=UPI0013DB8CFE|nr:YiiX/YebB-like N1pC/P60 family cysteine hydrolase [Stenotrophomonas sp. B1-1]